MKLILNNEEELNFLIKNKLLEPKEKDIYILYTLNIPEVSKALSERNTFNRDQMIPIEVQVDISDEDIPPKQQSLNLEDNGHATINDWIDDWRSGWAGKRAKGMGDRAKCVLRMNEFFRENPQYTKQDVFDARDRYFKDTKKQYNDYTYLQQADYFIRKKNKYTGEVTRNLLAYCEQIVYERENDINDNEFTIYDDI
jgi:hypothetical protein